MSLAEIKTAIEQLSFEERAELAAWLHGWNDDEWDEQMKRDIGSGKLDDVLHEVEEDIKSGRTREMPWRRERIGVSGMSSTDYRLTSNVSREKSFNSGCVIRSTRQCSSNRSSEMSGPYESAITIALLRRNTAISSSGFGSARTKTTTTSSSSCGNRWAIRAASRRSHRLRLENWPTRVTSDRWPAYAQRSGAASKSKHRRFKNTRVRWRHYSRILIQVRQSISFWNGFPVWVNNKRSLSWHSPRRLSSDMMLCGESLTADHEDNADSAIAEVAAAQ